ncbi:hypothetical protein CEXT_661881 [Caerostris extrusa]|uniref:Uncharacterized protein n=1 Tax=Caerostris extrusa TaxID=172846 RepID=A0AAV4XX49_CAEEX|nr:hypothetical protein CEXT_661881 [Caerostris extrusa]
MATKSLCMYGGVPKSTFSPNTRATIPIHGYINNKRQSPGTVRWLDFIAYMKLLLYVMPKKVLTEACFYHECPICYDPDRVHPLKDISMASVRGKNGQHFCSSSSPRFPCCQTLGTRIYGTEIKESSP